MKKLLPFVLICGILVMGCKENDKKNQHKTLAETVEATPLTGSNLEIIPIEHATVVLKWNDITIYIDPVGGAKFFEHVAKPDLILITDIHGDHFNLETLQELDTKRAKIMVPQAVADRIPEEFTPQIDVLHNGESKERYAINVTAVPMYNLRAEALKFHTKGRGNGYVLEMNGERLYFSGDTEDIPEMRSLKAIDKAFICMNLPYTMTEESAAAAVIAFSPKKVYPYHYRGRPNVSDVTKFKNLVKQGNSEIEVVQLDWYPNDEF